MKSTPSPLEPVFLRAGLVRSRYGGIGAATLWRWIKARKFPAPRYLPGGHPKGEIHEDIGYLSLDR